MANRRVITSEPRDLIREDYLRWGRNALIFAGPALVVFLGSIAEALPADWRYAAIGMYLLNTGIDLLRKFLAENKYQA